MGNGGRWLVGALCGAVAAVAWPGPPSPVAAAGLGPAVVLPQVVGDTPADEARLLQEVEASLGRKRSLDGKLGELDGRLKVTQSDLTNAQARLSSLVARQGGTEARLAQIRQQLEDAHHALARQAIAAYIGQTDAGRFTGLLLSTPDIGEFATKQSYLRVATATQTDIVATRERLRDQTRDLLDQLGADRDRAKAERDTVASQQARLKAERESESAVRYQVTVEIANQNDLLQEVIARKDEFQGQALELEAQSAAIAETIRGRSESQSASATSSSSSTSSSGFADPLPTISVASPFGYRVHPIYGDVRLHTGVDLNAGSGAPIRAVADGAVISAGWLGGYGNATIVEHSAGLATLYAHQSAILVSVGQRVTKGQVIGRVGCTGSCTGPHLHFEVRVNGNPVNPMPYL